jgi:hypothetical protein
MNTEYRMSKSLTSNELLNCNKHLFLFAYLCILSYESTNFGVDIFIDC